MRSTVHVRVRSLVFCSSFACGSRDVLPAFLVGHVKKAKRAMIWDAVVTIRTVMLTWGDTMSDYYALVLLLHADSTYTIPSRCPASWWTRSCAGSGSSARRTNNGGSA